MKIYINNKQVDISDINNWELNRSKKVAYFLQSNFNYPLRDITLSNNKIRQITDIRTDLTKLKIDIGNDNIRRILERKLRFSTFFIKIINLLCLKRRKSCVIEIFVQGCSSSEMIDRFFDLMLNNSDKNLRLGIMANPDHYILRGIDKNIQEVIESTGGSPMPTHFFVHYGKDIGLKSKADKSYPYQAAGVCYLKDGTAIGGVRHQFRNEGNGIKVRLEVEFPSLLPKFMIKQHQLHLACEFSNWFNNLVSSEE